MEELVEPREIFLEEIPLHERPVGATAESPEDFWLRMEELRVNDPLMAILETLDNLRRR